MNPEILISIIVTFIAADGSEEDLKVHFLDGSPHYKCLSDIACSRVGDKTIFLDVNKVTKRDDCGRNPLYHEIAHFKYMTKDVHNGCHLNAQIVHWKNIA